MPDMQKSDMQKIEGERIAKYLARAGVASRREAERLIEAGRIKVNGTILTTPAFKVTDKDVILFDGKPVKKDPPRLWRYHKEAGFLTTHSDPEDRPTVFEQLPEDMPRVISVGRLDMTSEGLLLLTNDGELARALELPATGWVRRYRARAYGKITQEELDTLMRGIDIDGIQTGAIEAVLERQQRDNAWITVSIKEGKNREVRRALEHLGLRVNRLIRVSYGPFQLSNLVQGKLEEVKTRTLRDQVGHLVDIPMTETTTTRAAAAAKSKVKDKPSGKKPGMPRPDRTGKPKRNFKPNHGKSGDAKSSSRPQRPQGAPKGKGFKKR